MPLFHEILPSEIKKKKRKKGKKGRRKRRERENVEGGETIRESGNNHFR